MQRKCWCGGRPQCEHEDAEAVDDVVAYAAVQEREQEEKMKRELEEIEEWKKRKAEDEEKERKKKLWKWRMEEREKERNNRRPATPPALSLRPIPPQSPER